MKIALGICCIGLSGCGVLLLPFAAAGHLIHGPGDQVVVTPEAARPPGAENQGRILVDTVAKLVCFERNFGATGFIHKSATLITAAHVVENCSVDSLRAFFSDGTQIGFSRAIYNSALDLAVLFPAVRKALDGRTVVTVSPSDTMTVGEGVAVWGFPTGVRGTRPIVNSGVVSGVDPEATYVTGSQRLFRPADLWIIDGSINRGNSGSPVIRSRDGFLVGVVIQKSGESDGIGYAVGASALRDFLRTNGISP